MIEHVYVITVRETPKSVNVKGGGVGQHWAETHKDKKKWEGLFMLEFMTRQVRKGMQLCTVNVTVRFKNRSGGKGRDKENFRHPVVKPLADALVRGGYLSDDADELFKVGEFELEEGVEEWPHADPRIKSELVVQLVAQYL